MTEAKIIVPPGVEDPRDELPDRDSVEECPKCKAPKDRLGGGRMRFPVVRNKLVCLRCGEEVPVR